jgi:chromate transporter
MTQRLWELARLFLKMGATVFGGPAVYIAAMQRETVERRDWLSREAFLDLLGVTYLLPGPNAVEMANHVGFRRAGILGCLVAGTAFTLPAALISGMLAWVYVEFGDLPEIKPLLLGIKPVVLGIVFAAVCRLAKSALKNWQAVAIAAGVAAVPLAGVDEVLALLAGSLIGVALLRCTRRSNDGPRPGPTAGAMATATTAGAASTAKASGVLVASAGAAPVLAAGMVVLPLWKLGLFFLEIGAVLYGSGYVLAAYLHGGLVNAPSWLSDQPLLTEQQLLDAVAIGQITPGPLISTVTFVGYLLAGVPGAAVATVAILVPSFVLVMLVSPWVARLRRWRWAGLFLDAVTAASIGLTAAVLFALGRGTLLDVPSWLMAVAAAVVTLRWDVAPLWLVAAGATAGHFFCQAAT